MKLINFGGYRCLVLQTLPQRKAIIRYGAFKDEGKYLPTEILQKAIVSGKEYGFK